MSAGNYLLAIDAGTGSGRAVVFDRDGHQLGACQREWWHKEDPRFPGSMDFDVDGNVDAVDYLNVHVLMC